MATPAQSSRMQKFFGTAPEQLLKDALGPARGGYASWSDWKMFWSQLRDKTKTTLPMVDAGEALLKKITDSKTATLPGGNELTDALLNTIAYLTLYAPPKADDSKLRTFFTAWKAKEGSIRDWPQAVEVMRTLQTSVTPDGIMGPLIIGCSTLHSVKEYQKLSDPLGFPTIDEADITGVDSCFIFSYLKQMASEGDAKAVNVLMNTMNKMLTLPQQMKMNPKVAETTLLALLHMFRNVMSQSPVTDAVFMKRSVGTIQQFYLWPCPYGNFTRDLLQLMHAERLAPGAAMRLRLLEDSRAADYQDADPKDAGDATRSSSAFYLCDSDCKSTSNFLYVMDVRGVPERKSNRQGLTLTKRATAGPPPCTMSPTTQALCVLNMLKQDVDVKPDELEQFKTLTADDVCLLYAKMTTALSAIRDPDTAKDQRVRLFTPIKAEIKAMAAVSAGKPAWKAPAKFEASFAPSPPTTQHQVMQIKLTYEFVAKEDLGMASLTSLPFPSNGFFNQLEDLLNRYTSGAPSSAKTPAKASTPAAAPKLETKDSAAVSSSSSSAIVALPDEERDIGRGRVAALPPLSPSDPEIRIIIAGGDHTLHNVLCAYLFILQSNPHLVTGLKLKFFIVPFASNGLAAFLARHDSWYNRHIYVPFRTPQFMVPALKMEVAPHDKDRSLELPGEFLRSLVDSYVREANLTYNVSIYKVQAWQHPSDRKDREAAPACDQLIPFIQRVEIGFDAAVSAYRAVNKANAERKIEDVQRDRNFAWLQPPELAVKFTQMDLAGTKGPVISDDAAIYDSLLLANVPRKSDPCFPADPCSPWLEMFARPHKSFQRQPQRKYTLLGDPKQHVHTVDITSTGAAMFHVLIDGQRFGPYHRIRISPVIEEGSGSKAITFPVQTFFPLDV